ncbi:hypothetical protein LZC95_44740 [Pendulispora brunnea]|uniref:Lipoprotein n=1 Tax=Pendulispora brunnea TaxID=2905690 RepID=A0ABZ2K854_9BACT
MLRRSVTFASAVALTALSALFIQSSGCSSDDGGAPSSDAGRDQGPIIPEPDASSWTPANLFPALWLESDIVSGSNGKVTQWTDKSGKGNHALQPDAARQPKTTDFNGRRAVSFGPKTILIIEDSASLQWGTDDFAFFTLVRYTGVDDAEHADLYTKNGFPDPYPGVQMVVTALADTDAGRVSQFLMGTSNPSRIQTRKPGGYADGEPHLTSFRRLGSKLQLRVDFQPAGEMTLAPINVSAVGVPAKIGAQNESQWLLCDIATLIGVHATVSDDDVIKVETYLKERYGL